MAGGGKLDFTDMELTINANVEPITANVGLNHNGTANINADMGMDASIKGSKEEPIAMMMLGDQQQPISANITGDKERPISLAMEMTNLPRFQQAFFDKITNPRIKISLPGHRQLCFKVLGQELFSVCYGGEGQIKIQPLEPEEENDCHIPICDLDTRPFPK
jgi:hypothetical protein